MAEKNTHEVTLSGYKASCKETTLQLGVRGSSGMERLHITAQGAWVGMTITVTFLNGSGQSEPQLVGTDGMVDIPALATAEADKRSKMVFYGTDGASSVYTADLSYRVDDRSDTNIEDAGKNPEESAFEQFVQQVGSSRESALQAARNASLSAQSAGVNAESAQNAAASAAADQSKAQESARQAGQSADLAQESSEGASNAMEKAQAAAASAKESADKAASVEVLKPGSDFEVLPDGSFQLYKALALNSVSVSPSVLEKGSEAESVTVGWTANKVPVSLSVNGQALEAAKSGTAVLAGLNLTADTLFTVTAKDARMEVSKGAWVRFYQYVYSAVGTADAVPQTAAGCKKQAEVSAFGKSGAAFSYQAGQVLWLLSPKAGAKIQTNVLGTWADVETFGGKAVQFTQANGVTETYYAYRTGAFGASGTATYRIV